jgi:cyclopropane fatty-acyl-phospholipid synthase-like methyltransferase
MNPYWQKYWEERTSAGHRFNTEDWFNKCTQEHLFHMGKHENKQNVLVDVGCGAADLTVYYAPFFKKIYAIDPSSSMLKAAQRRIDSLNIDNIELIQGNACDFANKIKIADTIISTQVAQFLTYEQINQHLDECLKILNQKGSIFIFWIIDPKTEWLWNIGYFSEMESRLPQLIFRLLFREYKIAKRKMNRLPGSSIMGYSHAKERVKTLCETKKLEVEFCNTLYFSYRYNVRIRRKI